MLHISEILEIEKMYPDVIVPEYKHDGDSGMDIHAYLSDDMFVDGLLPEGPIENRSIRLHGNERILIKTGIKTIIPKGYEIQIRPRSGLALKHGITVVNAPATIDSGYRGEYGIILLNTDEQVK